MGDIAKLEEEFEQLKRFQERMKTRQPQEDEREKQRQDMLRQSYLQRTGRKDLTP